MCITIIARWESRGALIDLLVDEAESRGWVRLVLNAPRQPDDGRKLYEQVAGPRRLDQPRDPLRYSTDGATRLESAVLVSRQALWQGEICSAEQVVDRDRMEA